MTFFIFTISDSDICSVIDKGSTTQSCFVSYRVAVRIQVSHEVTANAITFIPIDIFKFVGFWFL